MERANFPAKDKTLELRFIGRAGTEQTPKIALYAVEKGVIRKVSSVGDGTSLAELSRNIKQEGTYAFGPDIEEKQVTKEMLATFRPKEKLIEWANTGVIDILPKWRGWILPIVCVHGDVHRCRPFIWPLKLVSLAKTAPSLDRSIITTAPRPDISIAAPTPALEIANLCAPICNAVVEVYEKTCCCKLGFSFDIDSLLARLKDWLEKIPPIPEPDPWPIGPLPEPESIPIPIPGPGPDPLPFRQIERVARISKAIDVQVPLGNPPEKLAYDYYALATLQPSERPAYIDDHYYLYPLFCTCSTKKVGETSVNENGEFSFCYLRPPVSSGCKVTYYYKVRQWQDNQWVYIYDGSTTNDYFKESDDARLRTWKGLACDPGTTIPDPGGDFVMLENIGVIPSWKLDSPLQNSETGLSSANPGDGLVNHNYTGQPWAMTLSFRLKFTEGMKALGAKYYKVSVVKANSSGNPAGVPQPLTDPVAWKRWKWVGPQLQTEAVALGPNVVGTNSALYLIPYEADAPDGGWLWFQFHQSWNTTKGDNAKYLIVVEVFDAAGNRLKPQGAPGAGTEKPFTFRRWSSEAMTDPVNYAALVHMFHADNVSCYGDIVDLRKNGVSSTEECQFIQACQNDGFSVGFYAFHAKNFMASYRLWYHRGLNGPDVVLETGSTNAPAGIPPVPSPLNSANAKQSNSATIGDMLGPHQKCTFSIELRVYPKHTNGFGIIHAYRASDTAAVALEKVPCLDLGTIMPRMAERREVELPK